MRSLISEFSYGFALTHELVLSLGSLVAAHDFPSLIEEGKAGGAYDVMLEAPGPPLFLQFKWSELLMRGKACEIKANPPRPLWQRGRKMSSARCPTRESQSRSHGWMQVSLPKRSGDTLAIDTDAACRMKMVYWVIRKEAP